ncbi:uncharacterized protein LOC143280759 [Babylonia areolata]|uniref:uncharacterized protein LOC143280759 n=1 Tax=Babylonia areolata TaxID=304850 RepID=UPI003FD61265
MDPNMASFVGSTIESTDIYNTTVGFPSDRKTVHGCVVLEAKSTINNSQANVETLVSPETKALVSLIASAGFVPLLFLLGVPGNILSAAVFYRQGLRERINMCVFCLAVADVMVITVTFLISVEDIYRILIGSLNFFTKYIVGLTGFIRVSMFLSAVIAAERCFCVVSPLRAQRMLSTRTLALIIVFISSVLLMGLMVITTTKRTEVCVFDPRTNSTSLVLTFTEFYKENKKVVDVFSTMVYGTVLPAFFFVFIVVTTSITVLKLKSAASWRQQTSSASSQGGGPGRLDSHTVALTRMLIATSVLFVVCLSPILMVEMATFLVPGLMPGGQYRNLRTIMWRVINVCRCVNSSLNFFVYCYMGSRFRHTLREILFCSSSSNSSVVSANKSLSGSCG